MGAASARRHRRPPARRSAAPLRVRPERGPAVGVGRRSPRAATPRSSATAGQRRGQLRRAARRRASKWPPPPRPAAIPSRRRRPRRASRRRGCRASPGRSSRRPASRPTWKSRASCRPPPAPSCYRPCVLGRPQAFRIDAWPMRASSSHYVFDERGPGVVGRVPGDRRSARCRLRLNRGAREQLGPGFTAISTPIRVLATHTGRDMPVETRTPKSYKAAPGRRRISRKTRTGSPRRDGTAPRLRRLGSDGQHALRFGHEAAEAGRLSPLRRPRRRRRRPGTARPSTPRPCSGGHPLPVAEPRGAEPVALARAHRRRAAFELGPRSHVQVVDQAVAELGLPRSRGSYLVERARAGTSSRRRADAPLPPPRSTPGLIAARGARSPPGRAAPADAVRPERRDPPWRRRSARRRRPGRGRGAQETRPRRRRTSGAACSTTARARMSTPKAGPARAAAASTRWATGPRAPPSGTSMRATAASSAAAGAA